MYKVVPRLGLCSASICRRRQWLHILVEDGCTRFLIYFKPRLVGMIQGRAASCNESWGGASVDLS